MFKIIKGYYDKKLYTKEQIAKFVAGRQITAAQYQEITGDEYVPVEVVSVITELKTENEKITAAFSFTTKLLAADNERLEKKITEGAV